MKRYLDKLSLKRLWMISIGVVSIILSCKNDPVMVKESWVEEPIEQWPDFSLTNEISFTDTTFVDLANSFLINTGVDTVGVSCKHLFMVFENHIGLRTIDLGQEFNYWNLYPKNKKENTISFKRLINKNPDEKIGQFNTLKARDWIVFEVNKSVVDVYPLKIRYTPIRSNEIIFAVGWGAKQKDISKPALIKLQCFKNLGDYYFVRTLKTDTKPHGRSGSPVIDQNGYLVGIVSGQEGNLGVIGGVHYLLKIFDQYGVEYNKTNR